MATSKITRLISPNSHLVLIATNHSKQISRDRKKNDLSVACSCRRITEVFAMNQYSTVNQGQSLDNSCQEEGQAA